MSYFQLPIRNLACLVLLTLISSTARAQFGAVPISNVPGVYLDADGKVRNREIDEKDQLNGMRARAKAGAESGKNEKLAYLSLPKLFAQVRALRQANKEVPEELRYLGGLTQIRYVFVYPEEKDLVIVGPAEPWVVVRGQGDTIDYVFGKRTGRPVMQLDDLIVGIRTAVEGGGNVFGCGIYPSPESLKIAHEISQRMARNTRVERLQALRDNLGPQVVKIFGTRDNTRFAYVCVAADYEMKRFALGVDKSTVPMMASAMDNTRSAANKFWFEASYQPLLTSKDGNAFEIRGQRLTLNCGEFDFDPRGATETAKRWTVSFAKHIPELATVVPLFAELQNVADEAFLGNLIRRDRLAERVGWDNAWIFSDSTCPVAAVPVPKTCETVVSFTNGSMVAGGVAFGMYPFVDEKARQADEKLELQPPLEQAAKVRASKDKTVVNEGGSIFREQ
jgi:hypothetical protein